MAGAITAVAATTTVGIGAIIAIDGDFYLKAQKGIQLVVAPFSLDVAIKDFRRSAAIADKPDIASSARLCRANDPSRKKALVQQRTDML